MRDLQRTLLEIFTNDEVEEKGSDAVLAALLEHSPYVAGAQPYAGHCLQVLTENDSSGPKRHHQDDEQQERKAERQCAGQRLDPE